MKPISANGTRFERIRTEVETPFLAIAVCEVLHGCRQLVP